MIGQSGAAIAQFDDLVAHYLRLGRVDAAQNLIRAHRLAVDQIEKFPERGTSHPRPYATLVRFDFRWIKVHRYWFGYGVVDDRLVLTNVLYDAADLPSRVQGIDRVLPADDEDTTAG